MKNKGYAKFRGAKEKYYGRCANGEYRQPASDRRKCARASHMRYDFTYECFKWREMIQPIKKHKN